MTKRESKSKKTSDLRKRAEKKIPKSVGSIGKMSVDEVKKLVHELQVHQIELEMQNEALKDSMREIEKLHNKYSDLFDHAPIGYFILDKDTFIIETNFTGASLLGFEKGPLIKIKRHFYLFVTPEYFDIFQTHLDEVFASQSKHTCRLKMTKKDKKLFDAVIETIAVRDSKGRFDNYRCAVTDITEIVKAEQSLQESEKRYRHIVEDSTEFVCRGNIGGTITFINEAFLSYTGMRREELLGRNVVDFIPDADREVFLTFLGSLTAENQIADVQQRVLTPSGDIRWHLWTVRAVYDKRGRFIEFQGTGRDITGRKKAEEALQASEDKFSKAFGYSPNAITITRLSDGKIIEGNESAYDLFGYSHDEVVGKTTSDLNIWANPADRARLVKELSARGFIKDEEFVLQKKDGTHVIVDLSASFITIGDEKCFLCSFVDITERKRAEEALQKSEERFRQLADSTFEGLLIHDRSTILDANKALTQLIGYDYVELIGKNVFTIVAPESREVVSQKMQYPSVAPYEISLIKKNGTTCLVEAAARDLTYEGKTARVVALRDITERKRAEEELIRRQALLEEANKELESFSYSVSHDLRAPLRAIDGYARMLLKKHGHEFDEDSLRKFNVIRSSTHVMGQLIDDLLTLSRLGRKQVSMSKIDMEALIGDVWKELQADRADRNINLTVKSMPSSYGDRALIKQVYINLLSNAVKFTKLRDPAFIEVGGYVEGTDDIYYVKDNGVGFDMSYYDKLFGVFQRLHRADEFEGTGIGLALVQRIIRRHGGKVWAEGKEGEGATFYFSLPPPRT